jgi:hypothetical protein
MAGVPINMTHLSVPRSKHSALFVINAYALCFAFYMDIIIHNDDLKNFMKNFQALNSSRYYRVPTMVYNTQKYWVFGLCD